MTPPTFDQMLPHNFVLSRDTYPSCWSCGMLEHYEIHNMELKKLFSSGTTSTIKPLFQLLPYNGLKRAAGRYEEGLRKHGDKAWNALSPNRAPLLDREWLIERLSHGIQHAYNLIEKLSGKTPLDSGEDDAGAIAWCGLTLGEAVDELLKADEDTKKVEGIKD